MTQCSDTFTTFNCPLLLLLFHTWLSIHLLNTRSLFALTVKVSIFSWTVDWFEIDSCFSGLPKQKSKYEKNPLHYTLPQFPARGLALAHSSSSRGIGAENQKARPKETDTHDADWWHANRCIHHCLWILIGRPGEGCCIFSLWWTEQRGKGKKYICSETATLVAKGQGLCCSLYHFLFGSRGNIENMTWSPISTTSKINCTYWFSTPEHH